MYAIRSYYDLELMGDSFGVGEQFFKHGKKTKFKISHIHTPEGVEGAPQMETPLRIAGEFDDSALMKAFGEAGAGLFAASTAIEKEICRMYRMAVIGRTEEIEERFYAISPERRLRNNFV